MTADDDRNNHNLQRKERKKERKVRLDLSTLILLFLTKQLGIVLTVFFIKDLLGTLVNILIRPFSS